MKMSRYQLSRKNKTEKTTFKSPSITSLKHVTLRKHKVQTLKHLNHFLLHKMLLQQSRSCQGHKSGQLGGKMALNKHILFLRLFLEPKEFLLLAMAQFSAKILGQLTRKENILLPCVLEWGFIKHHSLDRQNVSWKSVPDKQPDLTCDHQARQRSLSNEKPILQTGGKAFITSKRDTEVITFFRRISPRPFS